MRIKSLRSAKYKIGDTAYHLVTYTITEFIIKKETKKFVEDQNGGRRLKGNCCITLEDAHKSQIKRLSAILEVPLLVARDTLNILCDNYPEYLI